MPGHGAIPARIRQVVRNLISNALRYGGTNIRVLTMASADTSSIMVTDDGIGVPLGYRERIFEPYATAHEDCTQPGSVGLGLSVAQTLARRMGARSNTVARAAPRSSSYGCLRPGSTARRLSGSHHGRYRHLETRLQQQVEHRRGGIAELNGAERIVKTRQKTEHRGDDVTVAERVEIVVVRAPEGHEAHPDHPPAAPGDHAQVVQSRVGRRSG